MWDGRYYCDRLWKLLSATGDTPSKVADACPLFSQAAAAHKITAHVARENRWRPDHTVMLIGLLERLGINKGE